MEVDHLRADIDRHNIGVLSHAEAERVIERHHRVDVLHRQRDMIETAHAS